VVVPEQWIDINGHMNATHYGLVIYDAHVEFTRVIGLGDDYVARTNCGKAVLASHMVYEREIALGDRLEVRSWLLAVDDKRLHFFHELFNATKGCRAATSEQVDIHIDLRARRSSPLPEDLRRALRQRVRANLAQTRPDGVGSGLRPPANDWLDA
jgi:acyl-CoA thioester hydrolase